MKIQKLLVMVLATALIVMPSAASHADDVNVDLSNMVKPQYTDENHLVLPTNYRTWIFAGASIGLSYFGKQAPAGPGTFHHIYIQPEAYSHYVETGKFPEKTMLVMENYSAGSKEKTTAAPLMEGKEFEILHGHYEDARVGVEVALKDSEQFEDGWVYFNFSTRDGLKETSNAFPKAVCWSCHNTHGADDNVFVQFYPVLRDHLEKRLAEEGTD